MKITGKAWNNYIKVLRRLSDRATTEMLAFTNSYKTAYESGVITKEEFDSALIDYAYALATKYGEGAGAAACEMYDSIAELQGANVPPAVPAETATYGETAKTVNGTLKTGNPNIIASATGRLVKQVGADTTLQNAKRDGAYFAWVSKGETCAFCLTLAGLGWQRAGELTLDGGHAEHIHANCDCAYAIDLKGDLEIEGYNPDKINQMILDMTDEQYDAEDIIKMSGHNAKGNNHEALNMMRRKFYSENKELINEQKRTAYALKKDMEEVNLK